MIMSFSKGLSILISFLCFQYFANGNENETISNYSPYSFDENGPIFYSHYMHTGGTAMSRRLRLIFSPKEIYSASADSAAFKCSQGTRMNPSVKALFAHASPSEPMWKCNVTDKYSVLLLIRHPIDLLISFNKHQFGTFLHEAYKNNRNLFKSSPDFRNSKFSLSNFMIYDCLSGQPPCDKTTFSEVALEDILARETRKQSSWIALSYRPESTLNSTCPHFYDNSIRFFPSEAFPPGTNCPEEDLILQSEKSLESLIWFGISGRWAESVCLFHYVTGLEWVDEDSSFCSKAGPRSNAQKTCPVKEAQKLIDNSSTSKLRRFIEHKLNAPLFENLKEKLAVELEIFDMANENFNQRMFQAAQEIELLAEENGIAAVHQLPLGDACFEDYPPHGLRFPKYHLPGYSEEL